MNTIFFMMSRWALCLAVTPYWLYCITYFREMIVADSLTERVHALESIKQMQIDDFMGIFEVMDGLPVTIRLLDPPLHEFVPGDEFDGLAKLLHKNIQLKNINPKKTVSIKTKTCIRAYEFS